MPTTTQAIKETHPPTNQCKISQRHVFVRLGFSSGIPPSPFMVTFALSWHARKDAGGMAGWTPDFE
jgi:hypothetical protein